MKRYSDWVLAWIIIVALALVCSNVFANLNIETGKTGKIYYVIHYQVDLDNSKYQALFNALDAAKKGEEIHIILRNNYGGAVITMDMIRDRIHRCKARVIIHVEGFIASAAAHLSMQGDVTYLPYNSRLLWHTGSLRFSNGAVVRLTPSLKYWWPELHKYYLNSVKRDRWIYDPGVICWGPTMCMYNPFKRTFVSKEYWEFFKTGYDEWISGREVCQHARGWTKQTRNGDMYCIIRGLK